jgi:hypothetical protein
MVAMKTFTSTNNTTGVAAQKGKRFGGGEKKLMWRGGTHE